MAVTTDLKLSFRATQSAQSPYEGGALSLLDLSQQLASGTGLNQADKLHHSLRTLGTTNEDIDLKTILDQQGTAINLAELVFLAVYNPPTSAGNLTLKPGAFNGCVSFLADPTDSVIIPPGACALFYCPAAAAYAVGASTKVINIANAGASTAYTLIVLGRSA